MISWRSVLSVEETGENYSHAASNFQTLSNSVYRVQPVVSGFRIRKCGGDMHRLHTSCIPNYHRATTGPIHIQNTPLWWFVAKRKTKNKCLVYRSCCKNKFVISGQWRFVARRRLYQMNTTENGFSVFIHLY